MVPKEEDDPRGGETRERSVIDMEEYYPEKMSKKRNVIPSMGSI